MTLDEMWQELVDWSIATDAEIKLVTDINGYNEKSLLDILYSRTGYRNFDQLEDAVSETESKQSFDVVDSILEGKDIKQTLIEASTTLRDQEITSADDVEELYLYIVNDGNLYRSRTTSIIDNLKKKYKKGTFDKELAVKAFMYLVDDGVRKYDKEFGSGQGKLFLDKATRTDIARELLNHYMEQIEED